MPIARALNGLNRQQHRAQQAGARVGDLAVDMSALACDDPLELLVARELGFNSCVCTSRQPADDGAAAEGGAGGAESSVADGAGGGGGADAEVIGRGTGPWLRSLAESYSAAWLSYSGTQAVGDSFITVWIPTL